MFRVLGFKFQISGISHKNILCLAVMLWHFMAAAAVEPVLMQAGPYKFDAGDFEYVYHKNQAAGKITLDECLSLYIPYKLKIVAAKDAGLDTLPEIISEWTRYRDQLANKYLIDTIVGKHLLTETYARSRYEIKAAHIQVSIHGADTLQAYRKIMQIRQRALAGEDFAQLATNCSDDPSAKTNGGQLGWLTVFQTEYPFETAAYNTPVGQISMPVRTWSGYHIILVSDLRPCEREVLYEAAKPGLKQKIINSDRLPAAIDAFAYRLKEKYHFAENNTLLQKLFQGTPHTNSANDTLFSFAGQIYSLNDFEQRPAEKSPNGTVEQAYRQFVTSALLNYETSRMETCNRDFREVSGEYLEGLLLFAISDSAVWSTVAKDSTGLKAFYKQHAKAYRWEKRMDATIYYCSDEKVADRLSRTVANKNAGMGRLPDALYTFFCSPGNASPCVDTVRQMLPKDAKTVADRVKWKKGCSKILEWNGKFVFLDVHAIIRPARKTFEEARGEVMGGYQNELETRWVEQLKKQYPVTINEVAWAELKKKYAE